MNSVIKADFTFPDEHWENISDGACDLVESLLVIEPSKRPTFAQVKNT